ncbi:MAG: RagB/SusD family nutrient uptake outer membrane protein [Prevotella sp.]|nr:RagB/SusD family nutrient uptake outer membrane protein [Prevotella sp.]
MFTSCNDMLDTDPRVTELTTATFPGKPADVEALNAATYSIMNTLGGGDQSGILNNPFYWWSLMSDDCYGSGGLQDNVAKSLHHFTTASANQYEQDFILLYGGISRANNQIETIDNVDWTGNKAQRNQLLGEGYFMRGFYTLLLTQLYGDVPLITSTLITDEMQKEVSAEEFIYPQILSDFVSAKNLMKAERANGSGHADKFAAEAFIARAWMFWAGFYKEVRELATDNSDKTDVELVAQEGCPEGSKLTKADVVNYLKDIVANGGYKLCEDFRSLWQYSNSLLWDEAHDGKAHAYEFIADMKRENCFDQPGMGNGNTEEIFQIQFMNASKWAIGGTYNNPRMYSNYLSCFWGLRNGASNDNGKRDKTYPFNQGWGQGTPSVNIWEDWTKAEEAGNYTDIRKLGSLIDLDHELAAYTYEKDDCEESGYAVKKYADVNLDACAADNDSWWSKAPGYSSSSLDNKQQGDHFEDYYLMRYADVLLMLTELTGDRQYMNQVQRRAGVPETPYSLTAVQNERRWEFALEGLRFNDMRRWSGADKHSENSYAALALEAQSGKSITVKGQSGSTLKHMTCSWKERYAATKGFLPKPQAQITLMNGAMKQNEGWDLSDKKTIYKVLY